MDDKDVIITTMDSTMADTIDSTVLSTSAEDTYTIVLDGTNTLTFHDEDPADTVTFDSGALDLNLDWINDIQLNNSVLWEDKLPKIERVKKMCEEYPALNKAYENFKSIYNMVDQDYKGKLKERGDIDDDDIPF